METLVARIKELEDSDIEEQRYLAEKDHKLVPVIAAMLDDLFITAGGHMNYDAKYELMADYGYELYPVERDSCGWVLGGLITSKGTIIFG